MQVPRHLDVDRRFFRFEEEFALAADAEAVIGCFGGETNLDRIFVDHIAVGFGITGAVVHVPAERFEKRINEVAPDLCLVVLPVAVCVEIALEVFDQGQNGLRGGHHGFKQTNSSQRSYQPNPKQCCNLGTHFVQLFG